MLNLQKLFDKGYRIVQSGVLEFSIRNSENNIIVEVEIVDIKNPEELTIKNIKNALSNEIQVHIERIEEDEDYFDDCTDEQKEHIKTVYLKELKSLKNILLAV
jgi:hypothetical protein